MTPEEKKQKASKFISGSDFNFGHFVAPKITPIEGIVPKRNIPHDVVQVLTQKLVEQVSSLSPTEKTIPVEPVKADKPVEKITPTGAEKKTPSIEVPKKDVPALGRVTLDLEIINNNLDKIAEIIKQDFKQTKEINKKEIEDYRKRVANRGRVVGKKEFGDRKIDVAGIIKNFVGTFFSGTGGAIRSLAGLNILEGIMTGDPMKILGGLTGITVSYLPAIGMAVGGKVVKSIGKGLFKGGPRAARGFGGLLREGRPLARVARGGGRLALAAGLGAAAVAIGSKIFRGGGQSDQVQQMIEPKKDGEGGGDILMPDDLLKKFDDINTKFEQAVDRLLGGGGGNDGGGGSGSTATIASISDASMNANTKAWLATIRYAEGTNNPQGYTELFGGGQFTPGEGHPNKVVTSGEYSSAAAGAYQFMPNTWQMIGGGRMDPNRQDRGAVALGLRRGVDFSTAQFTPQNVAKLAPEWASFPTMAGASAYGNQPYKNFQDLLTYYNRALKQYQSGVAPSPQLATPLNLNQGMGGNNWPAGVPRPGTQPSAPVLPPPGTPPTSVTTRTPSPRPAATTAPTRGGGPRVFPVPVGDQAPSQTSSSVSTNDIVPAINTTYSENFLALYSKLTYQIV